MKYFFEEDIVLEIEFRLTSTEMKLEYGSFSLKGSL